jgi:NTE family protein
MFWEGVTASHPLWPAMPIDGFGGRGLNSLHALLVGQPGFFAPRPATDWLFGGPTSFYDTSALKTTLERLVDFDRINAREMRFSVGAVNVRTGNFAYFDNAEIKIRPEHVMASGALPPGFPAVEIDGEHYWDGGLVSNTPLQYVMQTRPRRHSLIFQVDLFPARGPNPKNLDEVAERQKDITYSSRTRTGTNDAGSQQQMRRNVRRFLDKLPPELRNDPVARDLHEYGCPALIDVAQLIYRPAEPQGSQKDYQFDRGTMLRRWEDGLRDARATLHAAPWKRKAPHDIGFRSFDVTNPVKPQK